MKKIQIVTALGLIAALAAVATLRSAENDRKEGKATVRATKGPVQYEENGSWMPVRANMELSAGTTIKTTGQDSYADLAVNGRTSAIRVMGDTTLQIPTMNYIGSRREGDTETMLNLESGSILGNIKKLSDNSLYEIKTPHGVAGIRGTDVQVTVTPLGDGRFLVTFTSVTGQLIVSAIVDGQTVVKVLHTGQSWTPGQGDVRPTPLQLIIEYRNLINLFLFAIETLPPQPPPIPIHPVFPGGGAPPGQHPAS